MVKIFEILLQEKFKIMNLRNNAAFIFLLNTVLKSISIDRLSIDLFSNLFIDLNLKNKQKYTLYFFLTLLNFFLKF